jgi:hypothetical protein
MRQVVKDRLGHAIYLTDERWNHICEEHQEMRRYRRRVLETVQSGHRFQDSVRHPRCTCIPEPTATFLTKTPA